MPYNSVATLMEEDNLPLLTEKSGVPNPLIQAVSYLSNSAMTELLTSRVNIWKPVMPWAIFVAQSFALLTPHVQIRMFLAVARSRFSGVTVSSWPAWRQIIW